MNPNSLCHRKIPNFLSRYISSNSLTYCVPTSKFVPGIVGPNLQGLYASVLRHSLQGLEGILLDSHKQKLMIFMSFETNYLSGLYAICFHEVKFLFNIIIRRFYLAIHEVKLHYLKY
ncbi:hypothetical protein JHK82_033443 [Glycine max]|uniref:Uncharacterized protein n=1 Tax=Glycine max TaxID=3847 RepID=A0A0R0HH65_SOYBN|nr:hypothetical protein JHK85_034164 [Glycine max]KAG4985843.1 hypothetical protein JHK86_033534 [Glycine max]KAG5119023.1 hypothetical protein JHK82_033443 [Glycine max]KAG5140016.1 hypothetical protein JHK84_033784 [Glycine max]KAH1142687.1 hypothetical protein GYH30_033409 [Glycine max]